MASRGATGLNLLRGRRTRTSVCRRRATAAGPGTARLALLCRKNPTTAVSISKRARKTARATFSGVPAMSCHQGPSRSRSLATAVSTADVKNVPRLLAQPTTARPTRTRVKWNAQQGSFPGAPWRRWGKMCCIDHEQPCVMQRPQTVYPLLFRMYASLQLKFYQVLAPRRGYAKPQPSAV